MGFELTDKEWAFYEVFGLFRLAVILQQIYYRYHHKQTTEPAVQELLVRLARAPSAGAARSCGQVGVAR